MHRAVLAQCLFSAQLKQAHNILITRFLQSTKCCLSCLAGLLHKLINTRKAIPPRDAPVDIYDQQPSVQLNRKGPSQRGILLIDIFYLAAVSLYLFMCTDSGRKSSSRCQYSAKKLHVTGSMSSSTTAGNLDIYVTLHAE